MEVLQLITEFEKHIYNSYLKVTRSNSDLPYRLRKNFEKIDDKLFIALKKLSSFFKKYPHIKVEDFFKAPYSLYPDEKYFPIDYYYSLKAIKSYTLFNKKQINMDPDSDEQLKSIKESLVFINSFCRKNNLDVKNYIFHKTNNEHSFIIHLKEHNVNVYTLLGFNSFEKTLKGCNAEIVKFIIGEDIYNNVQVFRTRLYNSKKACKLVELGLKKITENA